MFAPRYFPNRYFPKRYFPNRGDTPDTLPGGGYFTGSYFGKRYFAQRYFPGLGTGDAPVGEEVHIALPIVRLNEATRTTINEKTR
jgi:hypothetical protein